MATVAPQATVPQQAGTAPRALLDRPVGTTAPDRRWLTVLAWRLALLDVVVVAAAVAGALWVRFGDSAATEPVHGLAHYPLAGSYPLMALLLGTAWATSLALSRVYDHKVLGIGVEEYKRLAGSSLRFWGVVAIICFLAQIELARGFLAVAFPVGTAALLLGRWLARKVLHRARARGRGWSHRVLVVGGADDVRDLVVQLRRSPYAGLEVVGACVPGGASVVLRQGEHVPTVGTLSSVPAAVAATGADTVAVTSSSEVGSSMLKRLGWELEGAGVDLVVAPGLMDVAGPRVHVRPVAGLPLLHVEQPEFTGRVRAVKAAFDRCVAVVALVVLAPLLAFVAVAIKATSSGPVVFRQTRVGSNGTMFTLYKFRTMAADAETRLHALGSRNDVDGLLFKLRDDPRVTRVGRWLRRFSIDELPQLVNVLRGQMSLVGPRPALPSEAERYGADVARRLLVKPGMTGLWQVSGRSDLSWEDGVRLDLYYVENWSFAGDIQILWKTLSAVARSRGAY